MNNNKSAAKYTCLVCKKTFFSPRALSVHVAKSTFCMEIGNTYNTWTLNNINNNHNIRSPTAIGYSIPNVPTFQDSSLIDNKIEPGHDELTNNKDDIQPTKDINDDGLLSESGNYFEDEPVCFQNSILHEVKLLNFLNDFSAPLYAYSSIMKWAHDANILKYNFQTNNRTYQQVIENLEKVLSMQALRPTTIKV